MTVADITRKISEHFSLPESSCEVEVYDDVNNTYFDLDDSYLEVLSKNSCGVSNKTYMARVIHPEKNIGEDQDSHEASEPLDLQMEQMNTDSSRYLLNLSFDSAGIIEPDLMQDDLPLVYHLIFVRDVAPYQNDGSSISSYSDNEQKTSRKSTCIRPLQGVRTGSCERTKNFPPEIKIPLQYTRQEMVKLVIAFVLQEIKDDQVHWYLHRFKGFLPRAAETDSPPVNPICIDINRADLMPDGIFKLSMRICHLPKDKGSNRDASPFHTLDLTTMYFLHSAQHKSNTPRLACMLADTNGAIIWETFGLSDFIHPASSLEEVQKVAITIEESCLYLSLSTNENDTSEYNHHLKDDISSMKPSKTSLASKTPALVCIWVDANIHPLDDHIVNATAAFREIINHVVVFTHADQCLKYLNQNVDKRAIMIVSGSLGQSIVPLVHHMQQLVSIYIYCANENFHLRWSKDWIKIEIVCSTIRPICSGLKKALDQFDFNHLSFDVIPSNKKELLESERLIIDRFFAKHSILKILSNMNYDHESFDTFVNFCRLFNNDNRIVSNMICRLEREYRYSTPIAWYKHAIFIQRMLDEASRTQNYYSMIKLGYYIKDLDQDICRVHQNQSHHVSNFPIILYRGVCVARDELDTLKNSLGGLLSFNSFLSTSKSYEISLASAYNAHKWSNVDSIPVVLIINVVNTLVPFAEIRTNVHDPNSKDYEVLFAIGSVFRIESITEIDEPDLHWRVLLITTSEIDEKLTVFTSQIQTLVNEQFKEVGIPEYNEGWYRLGALLRKIGKIDEAVQIYDEVLKKQTTDYERLFLYEQLESIAYQKRDHIKTLSGEMGTFDIAFEVLLRNHVWETACYHNLDRSYQDVCNSLRVSDCSLNELHDQNQNQNLEEQHCIESWINIACMHDYSEDYEDKILQYWKTLDFQQKNLPERSFLLAAIYNNLALLYTNQFKYQQALSYLEKTQFICQKYLSPDHPISVISYNNLGFVWKNMHDYPRALFCYNKSIALQQNHLPLDHLAFAPLYNNIGSVYNAMGEFLKAFAYFSRSLDIYQKTRPCEHSLLAMSYNNIGRVYHNLKKYMQAKAFYEKSLDLCLMFCSSDSSRLTIIQKNIKALYFNQPRLLRLKDN